MLAASTADAELDVSGLPLYGGGALFAAWIAWGAVREQMNETREIALRYESQALDFMKSEIIVARMSSKSARVLCYFRASWPRSLGRGRIDRRTCTGSLLVRPFVVADAADERPMEFHTQVAAHVQTDALVIESAA